MTVIESTGGMMDNISNSNCGLILAMIAAWLVGGHTVFLILDISGITENIFGSWISLLGIAVGMIGCVSGATLAWHKRSVLR